MKEFVFDSLVILLNVGAFLHVGDTHIPQVLPDPVASIYDFLDECLISNTALKLVIMPSEQLECLFEYLIPFDFEFVVGDGFCTIVMVQLYFLCTISGLVSVLGTK